MLLSLNLQNYSIKTIYLSTKLKIEPNFKIPINTILKKESNLERLFTKEARSSIEEARSSTEEARSSTEEARSSSASAYLYLLFETMSSQYVMLVQT